MYYSRLTDAIVPTCAIRCPKINCLEWETLCHKLGVSVSGRLTAVSQGDFVKMTKQTHIH